MTKLRPFWGVRPYGERASFRFLIATILADKAANISLRSPWRSKDIDADGTLLLVAVEPENTSRTVRCVLLYRAGGCCMLCVSHLSSYMTDRTNEGPNYKWNLAIMPSFICLLSTLLCINHWTCRGQSLRPLIVVVVVVIVVLIVTHVSISQNFHTSFQKVSLIDTHVSISFQKVSLIDTHVLNSQNFHTYFLRTFHLLTQREPAWQFAFQSH